MLSSSVLHEADMREVVEVKSAPFAEVTRKAYGDSRHDFNKIDFKIRDAEDSLFRGYWMGDYANWGERITIESGKYHFKLGLVMGLGKDNGIAIKRKGGNIQPRIEIGINQVMRLLRAAGVPDCSIKKARLFLEECLSRDGKIILPEGKTKNVILASAR